MAELYGIDYLKRKLNNKRTRVELRYRYYEMKDQQASISKVIPRELSQLYKSAFGWCAKAVDSLADRLVFAGFEESTDDFDLNAIFRANNFDILPGSAILSALISACSFIYIREDDTGYPIMQVLDGGEATGIIDEVTGLLTEGYAVLDRDKNKKPILEAYFLPGETHYFPKDKDEYVVKNAAPAPLLVPIINRPDAKRPFGHARISRTCMDLQAAAKRVLERSEVTAEFYSFPQKYVLGRDPDADPIEKWKATISAFLDLTRSDEEDGKIPTVGQFQQASMSPHVEQLRTVAALFAGETGLTLDDLGFVSDNPSSSEAIKASHENLRLTARRAQRVFGSGFLNAGYLAACLRDEYPYERRQLYRTKPEWEPVFENDASALGMIGDGAAKINNVIPGYFDAPTLRRLTGIDYSENVGQVAENGQNQ